MKVCFLGSGAWATALANVVSDNDYEVVVSEYIYDNYLK